MADRPIQLDYQTPPPPSPAGAPWWADVAAILALAMSVLGVMAAALVVLVWAFGEFHFR